MEYAGVDGSSHQIVGSRDGVNVTGEMEVELQRTDSLIKCSPAFVVSYKRHSFLCSSAVPLP